MHRLLKAIAILLLLPIFMFAQGAYESETVDNTVTVYATDSFCSDWGPGPQIVEDFETATGVKLELVSAGSAMEMLSKVIIEGEDTPADVVVGITDDMAEKAYEANILTSYNADALKDIPSFLQFDSNNTLLPYDYGNFAFVYDSEVLTAEDLTSLDDLLKPELKDRFVLIDPRTSSVGLGLLIWTIKEYGEENYLDWWKQAADNALTIADGWSTAYGLFTEGEADAVISYTTSPVYHALWEDSTRYQAAIFANGHSVTIEGLGILASSDKIANAQVFVDYILNEGQAGIALANSMYPVNSTVELDPAYQWAPKPEVTLALTSKEIAQNLDKWLDEWTEAVR